MKWGFEFLGYKVKQGKGLLKLPRHKIKKLPNNKNIYAIPTENV